MGASDDKQQLTALYERMYKAMIAKDSTVLDAVHADDFVLVHMTGMRQSKQVYIHAIMNGTLNYYSAVTEGLDIHVNGDSALITGHSRVEAAVFGGGCHTWPLSLQFEARRENGTWRFTRSQASTY